MRKLALAGLAVAATFVLAPLDAAADIRLSHHDFSLVGWSGGEICVPCHTPHNADTTVSMSPLWNHEVTAAVYTLYTSHSFDAIAGQPDGASKLCLSCHDGTVAMDAFGGAPGGALFAGFGNLGTDFTMHHPISISYDGALAATDGTLFDPVVAPSGLGGTIDEDLLRGGKLQCVSCHDVHLGRNNAGCNGCHDPFGGTTTLSLWKSNAGSALCLTCHDK